MSDVWIDSDLGDDAWAGDEQNPVKTHPVAWTKRSFGAGDTLWHNTGVQYPGGQSNFQGCPSGGGSWEAAVTLANIPGHTPEIGFASSGVWVMALNSAGRSYIVVDGFVFNGAGGSSYLFYPGVAKSVNSHHLRLIRNTFKNAANGAAVFTGEQAATETWGIEILDNTFEDTCALDGIYCVRSALIQGNEFLGTGRRAFQIHTSSGVAAPFTGTVARWNFMRGCGWSTATPTVLLWNNTNTNGLFYGNILVGGVPGQGEYGLVVGGSTVGWQIDNNSMFGFTQNNVQIDGGTTSISCRNNISVGAGASNWSGTSAVDANNRKTGTASAIWENPRSTGAVPGDFKLLASSAARGAGQDLSSVLTQDYFGRTYNPSSWDQGAIRYAIALQRLADRGPAYVFLGGY